MPLLDDVRVLVIDDEPDMLGTMVDILGLEGADAIGAGSGAEGFALLASRQPHVMVVDIELADEDGFSFVARARAEGFAVPAIAITAHSASRLADRKARGGFAKYLHKPFEVSDLLLAVASLAAAPDARAELRGILSQANAGTQYRYTSLFRFDGDALVSVWSFDRDNPQSDDFPTDAKVEESYCCFVRSEKATFVVADAQTDPRVAGHPKREALRAYCGVPVRDAKGRVVGSLCHFDPTPRAIDEAATERLEAVARNLEAGLLAKLSHRAGARIG